MPNTSTVYHYTDSAHLPFILASGELRPLQYTFDGLPRDLLYATRSTRVDGTATSCGVEALARFKSGRLLWVRFDLRADDFGPWEPLLARNGWSEGQVARMKATARRMGQRTTRDWVGRNVALPLPRVAAIHWRSRDTYWQELASADLSSFAAVCAPEGYDEAMTMRMGKMQVQAGRVSVGFSTGYNCDVLPDTEERMP